MAPREYPALLEVLMVGRQVRPRYGRHPRLHIWGPLEARLQQADLIILGGLNEGVWPAEADTGPWLNRPMRKALGLPSPERRVGLAAHDFAQAAAAPRVVLTRSGKSGGSPTVPSRWLLRLETLIGEAAAAQIKSGPWCGWQGRLDAPSVVTPIAAPQPKPPLAGRPRRLSVTGVETWMRDPYSIFAKHILGLKPLEPLDADPGAADRGTFIHHILEHFIREYDDSEADNLARLMAMGEQVFAEQFAHLPTVRAFWWPRFRALAAWFVGHERIWRQTALPLKLEHKGSITFDAPDGEFTLSATADRIDGLQGGELAIIDYKTGAPPSFKILRAGFAPQLPLEAAMARRGAFPEVAATDVGYLAFWRLSGRGEGGEVTAIRPEEIDQLAEEAWAGLAALVARFDELSTPYLARPRPEQAAWGDYDHLARVKEWSDS